jgi:biofilm PGA synthesis N-glycosyltransferase PgaC
VNPMDPQPHPRYVIITPARDEERSIGETIESVAAQTIRPAEWVIVDDGSTDATGAIIDRFAGKLPWVTVVHRPNRGERRPAVGVMEAFYDGLAALRSTDWEFIVKLDGDVELPPNYFERVLARFKDLDTLGIASGVYQEEHGGKLRTISMPLYHASGASKVIRRRCFEEIRGFISEKGWDTVDEIRAQRAGWATRHFADLKFRHFKQEGSEAGFLRTGRMHGEIYYRTGGGKAFFLLKVLHRLVFGDVFLLEGLMLLYGYLSACIRRVPLLVTREEAKLYRRMLNQRITGPVLGVNASPNLRQDTVRRI